MIRDPCNLPVYTVIDEGHLQISGLHILLTHRCTLECDHCFVWGSPQQIGVLDIEGIMRFLEQTQDAGVRSIYFEGGEPFLYYAELLRGVQAAASMGFEVGIVSNAYWAVSMADVVEWLQPFVGCVADLSISSDLYHCEKCLGDEPQNAIAAAKWLHIPTDILSIAEPEKDAPSSRGQLGEQNQIMFRGRAAEVFAPAHMTRPWDTLRQCEHEDLRDPGRLHVDPHGNLHICQGIVIGNLFEHPLSLICAAFDPLSHPICQALLEGGPAELVTRFGLDHRLAYADACHLCYEARLSLRSRFPNLLAPVEVYGMVR